jgi:anti-sigma factor RsiW
MSEHAIPVEWLALYHDGELGEGRRQQVEEHLPSCDSCQRELAVLVSLSNVLVVDRLSEDALVSQPVFWRKLEPRLPKRQAAGTLPLRWLPGIGLLVASGLAQFLVAASVVVMFVAGQFPSIAQPVDWLNRALAGWLLGGLAWLLPGQWGGWGLSLFFVALSAWLIVLYLVWLGYVWRHRPMSACAS